MNTLGAVILLGIGLVVVAGLAAYALNLRKEVSRRERQREAEERRARENSLENLDLVVAAMLQHQVDITEGAWRCKVLLEIIDAELAKETAFQAFGEMYARTRHLKTHSARQELTPRERMKQDKERLAIEGEMRAEVMAAAAAVMEWRGQRQDLAREAR
ncbi:DUF2489 domain-containing protein [Halomonas sp. Bachu 37]|uniref:DUF2489 domain-containing protein n=1 Tax=Halomonas kashgarensis TaxID=3084920 RepID=UPI003217A592